jgi:hypothetical protein
VRLHIEEVVPAARKNDEYDSGRLALVDRIATDGRDAHVVDESIARDILGRSVAEEIGRIAVVEIRLLVACCGRWHVGYVGRVVRRSVRCSVRSVGLIGVAEA